MEPAKIQGQIIERTYELDEDVVGEPMLGSLKCDYSLCEADFLRLTSRNTGFYESSIAVLLISVGYTISIAGKYLAARFSGDSATTASWEYWAMGLGFLAATLLYMCARLFPNERRIVIKDMEAHFRKHPRQRRLLRQTNVS